jgi:hypothetical protein
MAKFHRNASMIILLALLASGCLAPLSNSFTARSLGKGKIGLDGGMLVDVIQEDSVVLPAFAVATGLSSDFDLGVQVESASNGESDNVLDMEAGTYTYVQFTLGSIFWLNPSIGLNVEASAFAGNLGLQDLEDLGASSFVILGGVKIRF